MVRQVKDKTVQEPGLSLFQPGAAGGRRQRRERRFEHGQPVAGLVKSTLAAATGGAEPAGLRRSRY